MKNKYLISILLISCWLSQQIIASTIFVNSVEDCSALDPSKSPDAGDGKITLRSALEYANNPSSDGDNIISFNIPGPDYHIIDLESELPTIVKRIFIDGYSQDKSLMASNNKMPELMIEINGKKAGLDVNGLHLKKASDSVIRGLVINNCSKNGLLIEDCERVIISGNYIGTDSQGFIAQPNKANGIFLSSCNDCTLGGLEPSLSNLISGNQLNGIKLFNCQGNKILRNYIGTDSMGLQPISNGSNGILIIGGIANSIGDSRGGGNLISGNNLSGINLKECSKTEIFGNYIGTDRSGTKSLGNSGSGIELDLCYLNYIGGNKEIERNIICANSLSGIRICQSTDNLITGNYVGVDAFGSSSLPNKQSGIAIIERSINNKVGGQLENERNVISGNGESGILVEDSFDTKIENNYVGIDCNAEFAVPNEGDGICLKNSRKTIIGGTIPAKNTIAYNNGFAVKIEAGNSNAVLTNSIFNNKNDWAIHFIENGNNDQATPSISSTDLENIAGSLRSVPNESFIIQFFSSDNNAEIKEGKKFLGEIMVQTDSSGLANFSFVIPEGRFINCTATRVLTNETSRFSNTIEIEPAVKAIESDIDSTLDSLTDQTESTISDDKIKNDDQTIIYPEINKPEIKPDIESNNLKVRPKQDPVNNRDSNNLGNLSQTIRRKYKSA